jgi:hypothetical protein
MPAQPSPHATLEKVVYFPHDPLTSADAAECLGCHFGTINDACRLNKLEATKQNLRTHGGNRRYKITKAAIIRWLWENEGGDKQTLRAAMQELCPRILKTLEGRDQPKTKAGNILPFEHPDLFLSPSAHKQTA